MVKYLHDLYSRYSFNMLGFLVEVLEKGPSATQAPVLTIIHCLLHYVDMSTATQVLIYFFIFNFCYFLTASKRIALAVLQVAVLGVVVVTQVVL